MDKLQLENLTFKQLDDFTNEWLIKTKDFEHVFANQAQEINRWYFILGENNANLEKINTRMNIANHLQDMVDLNLNEIEQQQQELIGIILQLEEKTKLLYTDSVNNDIKRDQIYGYAEKLNEAFTNMQNKFIDVNLQIVKTDEKDIKDPAEFLARILMTQLYNLEAIESKLQKLVDLLQVINCKKMKLRFYGWNFK